MNWKEFTKYSDTFIETGTAWGRTVTEALKAGFKDIRSVEASDKYYRRCVDVFIDNPCVKLYYGMSVDRLPDMLDGIDKPCVFWLDAHVTGDDYAGNEDFKLKGNQSDYAQHKCLVNELNIILAHRSDHIILIDDKAGEGPDNLEYKEMMLKVNSDYKFRFEDEYYNGIYSKEKIFIAYL